MTEQERLYAQYEDAFFALLMHEIAEAEGEALLEQNEQLLADPDAAVPDVVRKRCLRTIEKSRRNTRLQSNTEKLLRVLNRVALWLLCRCVCGIGDRSRQDAELSDRRIRRWNRVLLPK